jgi:hypothetical protein
MKLEKVAVGLLHACQVEFFQQLWTGWKRITTCKKLLFRSTTHLRGVSVLRLIAGSFANQQLRFTTVVSGIVRLLLGGAAEAPNSLRAGLAAGM